MDYQTATRLLLQMKAELTALNESARDNYKPVALDQQSVGRLSRMDSLQVQAMDLAAKNQRQKKILRIDAALARLKTDDFGCCATCEEPIVKKRLELDPSTPLCINCARG